jgi:phosphopantetheinyl transferase
MSEIELPPHWRTRALVLRGDVFDLSMFRVSELAMANSFALPKRRREFLLSRLAAKRLACTLGLARDPSACMVVRPRLLVDFVPVAFVSVSHSAPYAAAAIAAAPVGIDVQVVRTFDERAAHLFLSDDETRAMQRCTLPHRALHFWCAKEAAWKRRLGTIATLRAVPLQLLEESPTGLRFDDAETVAVGDVIVAIS